MGAYFGPGRKWRWQIGEAKENRPWAKSQHHYDLIKVVVVGVNRSWNCLRGFGKCCQLGYRYRIVPRRGKLGTLSNRVRRRSWLELP